MSQIPAPEVTAEELAQWWNIQEQLGKLKSQEALLRTRIFAHFFKDPREGTNKVPLSDGWQLNATHVINRSIDRAALATLMKEFEEANIPVAELIEYKPDLKIGAYRQLTEEQRKKFDNALVIRPGTPQMKIELPKRANKG